MAAESAGASSWPAPSGGRDQRHRRPASAARRLMRCAVSTYPSSSVRGSSQLSTTIRRGPAPGTDRRMADRSVRPGPTISAAQSISRTSSNHQGVRAGSSSFRAISRRSRRRRQAFRAWPRREDPHQPPDRRSCQQGEKHRRIGRRRKAGRPRRAPLNGAPGQATGDRKPRVEGKQRLRCRPVGAR